jgi:large subunit ribosomal protein L20
MKMAKGYRNARGKTFRHAKETVVNALKDNYRDRKLRKQTFRSLWVVRINAAVKAHGMTYSRFIEGLGAAGVELNRKMLSELAVAEAAGFAKLVELAKTEVGLQGAA